MSDLFLRLAELRKNLEECLSVLDGSAPNEPIVGRSFDAMGAAFAELGDPEGWTDAVPVEERERLRTELSEISRLNAVVSAVVVRDKERLLGLRERAKNARRVLGNVSDERGTGVSCDLSG